MYTVHCTVHICSVHISPNCSVMPSAVETLQCISCQFLPVAKREPCCNNCQLLVQAELESGQWLTKAANPAQWDPGGDPSCHTVNPRRDPKDVHLGSTLFMNKDAYRGRYYTLTCCIELHELHALRELHELHLLKSFANSCMLCVMLLNDILAIVWLR